MVRLVRGGFLAAALTFAWAVPAFAAQPAQESPGNVFLGSPLLAIGIFAGVVAVIFALYSWRQMSGGAIGSVFLLLGLSLASFDLGVIAVTFFEVTDVIHAVHDVGLLLGFALAMLATNRMRSVFS